LPVQGNEKKGGNNASEKKQHSPLSEDEAVGALHVKTDKSCKQQTTKKEKKAGKRPKGKREEER